MTNGGREFHPLSLKANEFGVGSKIVVKSVEYLKIVWSRYSSFSQGYRYSGRGGHETRGRDPEVPTIHLCFFILAKCALRSFCIYDHYEKFLFKTICYLISI